MSAEPYRPGVERRLEKNRDDGKGEKVDGLGGTIKWGKEKDRDTIGMKRSI